MQGKILDYNSEFKSGLIRGDDGNKYRFSIDDCKSAINPKANAEVDFEPSGDKAVEVYVMTKETVDEIKDLASTAVNATANVAKEAVEKTKSIVPTIITLIILGSIGFVIWYITAIYLPEKRERQRITDLKNQCNNNIAKACYEYSMELKYYSGERTTKARNNALAKGCQLGDKDACREGEYYKEGCALQDGESCYVLAQNAVTLISLYTSESHQRAKKEQSEYYQKACQYGYSQGCIQK